MRSAPTSDPRSRSVVRDRRDAEAAAGSRAARRSGARSSFTFITVIIFSAFRISATVRVPSAVRTLRSAVGAARVAWVVAVCARTHPTRSHTAPIIHTALYRTRQHVICRAASRRPCAVHGVRPAPPGGGARAGAPASRRRPVGTPASHADPSTPASQKLATMYVQLNTRLATALTDHKWDERVAELPMSAPYCCRPCC